MQASDVQLVHLQRRLHDPLPSHLACISHHPTVEAHDMTARTSLRLLAVLNVLSSTPARAKRLAPRPDGPLTHFASPRGEKCRLGVCPTGIRAVVGHDGIIDDGTVREFGGDPSLHSGSDLRLIAIPSLLAVAGSLVLGSACYPTVASGTIPAIRRRFNASVTKLHSPWTLRSPRSENCRNPNLAFNHPKTGSTSPLRRA